MLRVSCVVYGAIGIVGSFIMKRFPFFTEKLISFSWRRIWVALFVIVGIALLATGSLFAVSLSYQNRVLPGVHIGKFPVGGMTRDEAARFLSDMNDTLMNDDMRFSFDANGTPESLAFSPVVVVDGNSFELVTVDIEKEVDRLMAYRKGGLLRTWKDRPTLSLVSVTVDENRMKEFLEEKVAPYELKGSNAGVVIHSIDPLRAEVTSSSPSVLFALDTAVAETLSAWSRLEAPDVVIAKKEQNPDIIEADVEKIFGRLPMVFDDGGIELSYTDARTKELRRWEISVRQIQSWISVVRSDQGIGFGLNREDVEEFLQTSVEPKVTVASHDAKFRIDEDGTVVEFQGSRFGISVDTDATYAMLNDAVLKRTWHDDDVPTSVTLAVKTVEPNVTTGEVNEFGISEVLGVGVSNFSGSPGNRIKNIRNAVNKLNGVLVKPGEEFSAILFTQPYTSDGGYLPELVIKGDEIKPEIGGGLCQIGTTLFRMAMNSGMPITERRNHSLVVPYYNDASGLPGTDATIYEPKPDFRFLNDTGHYILIQTEMNVNTGDLIFTLWGKNDGRKGSYTRPTVTRWIPHGEPKIVETTSMKPGEKNCQKAYRGADAFFTYTRELPDGAKEDRVFESHYRALPSICLVGVEEKIAECVPAPDGSTTCPAAPLEVVAPAPEEAPVVIE